MRQVVLLCILVVLLLLLLSGVAGAQTATPPAPTPVVVTATPGATPAPKGFWEENSKALATGLIGLIFGGILTWLLKPTFEGLGDALAAQLGKIRSGWGFERRYLIHLTEEYRGLNIRGLKTRAPVTLELEQVYVSLHAQVPDVALGRQAPPAMGIGPAMAGHRRLTILGGPGTGKTTLLSYLTLTYARDKAGERLGLKEKRLPVLVPLRQLKDVLRGDDGARTLPAYLTAWYTELGMPPGEGFFEKALQEGRCLVLLDGLDEVADEAERRQMSEWVDRLVTVFPGNRYVVTSRPPGYDSAPLENGFTLLRIRDFTAQEIQQFATNWCLAVELAAQGEDNATARRQARAAAQNLVAAIEANAAIRKLAVNPLLLSIIALVHRYRATLPRRRVDLYAECVDVLLGHWDAAKGLPGALSLAPGGIRAVLQPLALQMQREKRRDIPRRDLEARVGALLPAVGGEAADGADFVKEVRERSGLLIEVGLGRYAFSHLTFQEYLCAREIVDLGDRPVGTGVAQDAAARARHLSHLRQALDARFNEDELRALCSELGMDYDDLPGRGQAAKARELVADLTRHARVAELVAAGERLRPDISWTAPAAPEIPEAGPGYENARELLLAHAGEEWWQEVILLYVGIADATPVVEALLDAERDAHLLLAGRCIAEAVRVDEGVRERVLDRLEEAFATCTGERFLETGKVLAEIAGEDSVDFFLRLAHDDPKRCDAALWALGEMGRQPNEVLRERVLERLLAHLQREKFQREAGAVLVEVCGIQFVVDEMHGRKVSLSVLAGVLDSLTVPVPAGEFLMGDEEREEHKVHVDAFQIDKYPVTNLQYKRFMDATGHDPPGRWEGGIYPDEKALHPVVNVSWYGAVAYAEWAGKRLPTEAEWEKAARGTDGRQYPWGDAFDKDKCNTEESGIGDTTPVGRYSPDGDSPYGCADMAGNVWEWTSSLYKDYPYRANDGREDARSSGSRVVRGGSFAAGGGLARCAVRDFFYGFLRGLNSDLGFRCAAAPFSQSL